MTGDEPAWMNDTAKGQADSLRLALEGNYPQTPEGLHGISRSLNDLAGSITSGDADSDNAKRWIWTLGGNYETWSTTGNSETGNVDKASADESIKKSPALVNLLDQLHLWNQAPNQDKISDRIRAGDTLVESEYAPDVEGIVSVQPFSDEPNILSYETADHHYVVSKDLTPLAFKQIDLIHRFPNEPVGEAAKLLSGFTADRAGTSAIGALESTLSAYGKLTEEEGLPQSWQDLISKGYSNGRFDVSGLSDDDKRIFTTTALLFNSTLDGFSADAPEEDRQAAIDTARARFERALGNDLGFEQTDIKGLFPYEERVYVHDDNLRSLLTVARFAGAKLREAGIDSPDLDQQVPATTTTLVKILEVVRDAGTGNDAGEEKWVSPTEAQLFSQSQSLNPSTLHSYSFYDNNGQLQDTFDENNALTQDSPDEPSQSLVKAAYKTLVNYETLRSNGGIGGYDNAGNPLLPSAFALLSRYALATESEEFMLDGIPDDPEGNGRETFPFMRDNAAAVLAAYPSFFEPDDLNGYKQHSRFNEDRQHMKHPVSFAFPDQKWWNVPVVDDLANVSDSEAITKWFGKDDLSDLLNKSMSNIEQNHDMSIVEDLPALGMSVAAEVAVTHLIGGAVGSMAGGAAGALAFAVFAASVEWEHHEKQDIENHAFGTWAKDRLSRQNRSTYWADHWQTTHRIDGKQEAKSLFASFGVNLAFGLAGAAAFEFVLSPLFKAIARKFTKGAADETLTLLPKIADNEVEVKPTREIKFKTSKGPKPKGKPKPKGYEIDDPEAPWAFHGEVKDPLSGAPLKDYEAVSFVDMAKEKPVGELQPNVMGKHFDQNMKLELYDSGEPPTVLYRVDPHDGARFYVDEDDYFEYIKGGLKGGGKGKEIANGYLLDPATLNKIYTNSGEDILKAAREAGWTSAKDTSEKIKHKWEKWIGQRNDKDKLKDLLEEMLVPGTATITDDAADPLLKYYSLPVKDKKIDLTFRFNQEDDVTDAFVTTTDKYVPTTTPTPTPKEILGTDISTDYIDDVAGRAEYVKYVKENAGNITELRLRNHAKSLKSKYPQLKDIPDEDLMAVYDYSLTGESDKYNDPIWKQDAYSLNKNLPAIKTLTSALNRLRLVDGYEYLGTVMRGMNLSDDVLKKWKAAGVVEHPSFMSTTTDSTWLSKWRSFNTYLTIHNTRGGVIISEKEVLFLPQNLKIINWQEINGKTYIDAELIP